MPSKRRRRVDQSPQSESRRLRKCVNDLMSLQALPSLWSRDSIYEILSRLLDALVNLLGLEFAYARLSGGSIELVRFPAQRSLLPRAEVIRKALTPWLSNAPSVSGERVPNPVGEGEVTIRSLPLGMEDKIGLVIVGTTRADFPNRMEMLVFRSASSLAVIALQEVQKANERNQLAEELELRVMERTEELRVLNEELRKEMLARERAQVEERKLAALVENSTDLIAFATLEGQISFINRAGQALVGITRKQIDKGTLLDFVIQKERALLRDVVLPIVRREGHWEGELNFRHFQTGAVIPMLQHLFVIREADQPIGIASISRDIRQRKRDQDERRQAEDALQKLRSELAHVTRITTVGELSASIAHEINQPLGAIVNNGHVCLRTLAGRGTHEELGEALQDMVNDANRASAIVERMRAWTKRATPERVTLNIESVVADVLALAHRELSERQIQVRRDLSSRLPPVAGDRVQLQQVLLNLVINAVEAMAGVEKTRRVLTISARRDKLVGNEGVLLTVQDQGSGVSAEDSERIFEAFYTTKAKGLGMGLRISRSIVESHGGRLWAAANGKGACFHCLLPVAAKKNDRKAMNTGERSWECD